MRKKHKTPNEDKHKTLKKKNLETKTPNLLQKNAKTFCIETQNRLHKNTILVKKNTKPLAKKRNTKPIAKIKKQKKPIAKKKKHKTHCKKKAPWQKKKQNLLNKPTQNPLKKKQPPVAKKSITPEKKSCQKKAPVAKM